jgi:hypothetical protein
MASADTAVCLFFHLRRADALASNRSRAASSAGKFCSAHPSNVTSTSLKDRPTRLRRYSTCGGTVFRSCRTTRPLRSRSRSVCVSIFCDMPPMRRSRAPLRMGPAAKAGRISMVHLLATSSSAWRAEQLESNTLGGSRVEGRGFAREEERGFASVSRKTRGFAEDLFMTGLAE